MSDPVKFALGDWVMELIGGFLVAAGVGGMTMFNNAKAKIDGRLTCLEEGHSIQATQLAVLQTCQQNTSERLEEIRETTRDTNQKLDELVTQMTNRVPGGKRRTD